MLILIGVVGVQLTLDSGQTIARLLPFWGAQRLLDRASDPTTSVGAAVYVDLLYAAALFIAAVYIMHRRSRWAMVPRTAQAH